MLKLKQPGKGESNKEILEKLDMLLEEQRNIKQSIEQLIRGKDNEPTT